MRHTLTLLLLLLFVVACKGDPSGPNGIKAILIKPGVVVLTQAGATQQFTAQPVDDQGGTVSGVTVKWRSSNTAVVTIDAASGIATAVAEGHATIYAEGSGASGSASVTVDVPVCTQPTLVALSAGQTLVTDIPTSAACAVRLPTGALGDRYRVAIVRLTSAQEPTAPNAVLTLTPRGGIATSPGMIAAAPSLPPLLDAAEIAQLERSARIADATSQAHAKLRAAEYELLRRLGPFAVPFPAVLAPSAPLAVAPARKTFTPRTSSDASCSITGKSPATAVLVSESPEMAVYQDSAQAESQPVSKASVDRMLEFYAAYGKSTIDSYFGGVPDRDGNAQVLVYVTPQVANPVAAFVWGGDQLDVASCAASNQAELVYFNAGVINGLGTGNYQAYETLVHEVKHIVSFNHRMIGSFFNSHEIWVEEGTAEIAGEVASRKAWAAKGGPPQNAAVTRASFNTNPRITPENYGIYLRLTRTREYLSSQPNSVVYGPASGNYTIYGSGWHFSRFLGDAYGNAASTPGADAAFFTQQNAASTPPGVLGFEAITGKSFDVLLEEYAAAVMLNGTGAPAPTRAFTTYNFPDAISAFFGSPNYPYPVTGTNPIGYAGGTWSGPIGNAGLRIHDFQSNGTGGGADITVQVESPAKLVVVRLK